MNKTRLEKRLKEQDIEIKDLTRDLTSYMEIANGYINGDEFRHLDKQLIDAEERILSQDGLIASMQQTNVALVKRLINVRDSVDPVIIEILKRCRDEECFDDSEWGSAIASFLKQYN